MKKSELLKKCRYYKGEKEYNGDYSDLRFWEAEYQYVENEGTELSADAVKFYLSCGLAGVNYILPLELLAFLFEIYCKGSDTAPELLATSFRDIFLANYLAQPQ